MADRALTPSSYKKLVLDITALYEGARRVLVAAYWKIGQRIVQVEQEGSVKAAYGTGLLSKLSEELSEKLGSGFSVQSLRRMRQFYLENPKRSPASELTWAHHIELLAVHDKRKRLALAKRAGEESLDRASLRRLVQEELVREQIQESLAAVPEQRKPVKLLTPPQDRTLGTYKKGEIASGPGTGTVIDCGFYVYRTVTREELRAVTVTDKPSFAYEAGVERVIDGDTLALVVSVGFGTQVREKIRLRGIDAPELGTPEGEAAKRFVMKLLPVGTEVVLRSSRSDKYGRFVGDIFCDDLQGREVYLNNLLLETGHAIRVNS